MKLKFSYLLIDLFTPFSLQVINRKPIIIEVANLHFVIYQKLKESLMSFLEYANAM